MRWADILEQQPRPGAIASHREFRRRGTSATSLDDPEDVRGVLA